MKNYFYHYLLLLKGGFLKESYKFLGLVLLVFMILGSKISADVEAVIFTFLGMGIFSDLDEKKYTLASSLPIRVKTRIIMIYINTYVICFLGSSFIHLIYLLKGEARPVAVTLIIMLTSIIGCSIYYLIFSSNEFKKDPQEQVGLILLFTIILTIIAMGLTVAYLNAGIGIISLIAERLSLGELSILLAVLTVVTFIISWRSYRKAAKKIFIID